MTEAFDLTLIKKGTHVHVEKLTDDGKCGIKRGVIMEGVVYQANKNSIDVVGLIYRKPYEGEEIKDVDTATKSFHIDDIVEKNISLAIVG
jgi:hypothetical protein